MVGAISDRSIQRRGTTTCIPDSGHASSACCECIVLALRVMEIHTGSDRIGFALLCCGIGCAILGPETASGTTSAHCRASHRRILSGVRHVEFVEDVTNNRVYWLVETLRSFGGLDSGTTLSFLNSGRVCQVSSLQLPRHKLPSPRHFQHQRQKPSSAQQSTSISMVVIHLCHSSKQQAALQLYPPAPKTRAHPNSVTGIKHETPSIQMGGLFRTDIGPLTPNCTSHPQDCSTATSHPSQCKVRREQASARLASEPGVDVLVILASVALEGLLPWRGGAAQRAAGPVLPDIA